MEENRQDCRDPRADDHTDNPSELLIDRIKALHHLMAQANVVLAQADVALKHLLAQSNDILPEIRQPVIDLFVGALEAREATLHLGTHEYPITLGIETASAVRPLVFLRERIRRKRIGQIFERVARG